MQGFPLTPRRLRIPIGPKILGTERLGMTQVGIQRQEQRRSFLHDPHPRMTMPVNPSFVPLGAAKPPLQLQVFLRQRQVLGADKQPALETPHQPGEVLAGRVLVGAESIPQSLELDATTLTATSRRIERGPDLNDFRDLPLDRLLIGSDQVQPPIDATRQSFQERLGTPPFFASRFRWSDSRTSPNASAIRRPGGWSGPPWSSLRTPRTAAQ